MAIVEMFAGGSGERKGCALTKIGAFPLVTIVWFIAHLLPVSVFRCEVGQKLNLQSWHLLKKVKVS